jgi:hypothetical protein
MSSSPFQPAISWRPLAGLVAMQGAIALLWVTYRLYLPQLLTQFGWPLQFGITLLVIESAIATAMSPLMGNLSDRNKRRLGTELPLIVLGVIITSALTISIPAAAIFGRHSIQIMHWGIIFVLVAWAMAMTIFQTPATALLGKCASSQALPFAASFFTLITGLLKAAKPLVHQFIVSFGPAITFAIASMVLLGVTAILRAVLPPPTPITPEGAVAPPSLTGAAVALLVGIGLMTDLVVRIGFENSSRVLAANWPRVDPEWLSLLIGVGIAAIAVPAGLLATRFGNQRALCAALVATAVLSGLLSLLPVGLIPTLAVIALGVTLPFILNGGIAFSLSIVPSQKAGLGIGLYLSGTAIGLGLFSLAANLNYSSLVGQGLLVEAAVCLVAALWITSHKTPQTD